jgi:hypothetical protein
MTNTSETRNGPGPQRPTPEGTHTGQGAPTDREHKEAGDGTLAGSTPAGLTSAELQQQAQSDKTDDGGTG